MTSVNPGPASTSNPNTVAGFIPVNTLNKPVEVLTNALRLLAVARAVSLATTGDAAVVPIINSAAWSPATVVTANGLVSGVPTTVAAAGIGIFTGAGSTGTTVRTQGVLTAQTANASIAAGALAATAALQLTAQTLYINVGTALANATVDVFVYGYDQT